jgi:hypothetical protein
MTPFHRNEEFLTPEKLELQYLTKQIRGRMMRLEFMLEVAVEELVRAGQDKSTVWHMLEEAWVSRKTAKDVPLNTPAAGL